MCAACLKYSVRKHLEVSGAVRHIYIYIYIYIYVVRQLRVKEQGRAETFSFITGAFFVAPAGRIYLWFIWQSRGPGSSVGIATDYGLDGPGIESR